MVLDKIRKRDGRVVDFQKEKISNAIWKALRAVGEGNEELADKLADKVVDLAKEKFKDRIPGVEDIQNLVEKVLIEEGLSKVAKAYILYRKQRSDIRNLKYMFDYIDIVDAYLQRADWMLRENSNLTFSLQGLNFYLSSKLVSRYWRDKIYPNEVGAAHTLGDLHIHSLSVFGAYRVGWNLMDLLKHGFTGVRGKVQSRPAKHFRTALGQVVNFFYTLQGEAAGAQAFSNFDTLLAPFIRHDDLSYKEVKQAMQEFMFNMNVPTRVGFQTPFTNISLDVRVPNELKDKNVIIGGIEEDKKYEDFQKEVDMLNKALMEVLKEGDSKGRAFTFPIPTIKVNKDFNWDNEELWEVVSKYGNPHFANFTIPIKEGCEERVMGVHWSRPNSGSVGAVTINLPRIGYVSKDESTFFNKLDKMLELAKEALDIKRKVMENFTKQGLYPYSRFYLRGLRGKKERYWDNHFSTVGFVGMHESLLNFLGEGLNTKEGLKFAKKVMEFIARRLKEFEEESGHRFLLEATPAESASYRLALLDKEKYPDIITSGKKEPYYTTAANLPVYFTHNLKEELTIQSEIQKLYTGGNMFDLYLKEKPDVNMIRDATRKILKDYKIPYMTTSPTFSICRKDGYFKGYVERCPKCEGEVEVYSKISGYIRPINRWNPGRREEYFNRKFFDLKTI